MLTREIKLKPTKKQREKIDIALWQMRSVYNTALTKCFLGLRRGLVPSAFDLHKEFCAHGKKSGLNQDAIAECCKTVRKAIDRWLSKDASGKRTGKPRRKSARNKVTTLVFGQASYIKAPKDRHVGIPCVGKVRCSKNEIPDAMIKGGRLVKRASGYYFQFVLNMKHAQELDPNAASVGIDPGFTTLLTLSNGKKYENLRELRKGEERLAQAQKSKNKKLVARIHEKQKMRRRDRNHKISHEIVKNHSEIYVSKDSFKGMATQFGKSVAEASLGEALQFTLYKSQSCGRVFGWVPSPNSTRACSCCRSLTGPTGVSALGVREWRCSACGALHDRDINAAINILLSGQGMPSSEKVHHSIA